MIHIEEHGFTNRSQRLSDDVYALVIDSVVVACVDCAVVCNEKIFLGKRTDMPGKDELWVQGGRMQVGIDPRQTAQTILKREIGLEVLERDEFVDLDLAISYIWKDRSQPPEGHGCHMVGLYYMVVLDNVYEERLGRLQPNLNFMEFQWHDLEDVSWDSKFHEGIQKLASRILERI